MDIPAVQEKLATITNVLDTHANVKQATGEINNIYQRAQTIIDTKQQEIQKLQNSIEKDYDGFLRNLQGKSIVLTNEKSQSITLSAPLRNTSNHVKQLLASQPHPTETNLSLNKQMVDGYINALNKNIPSQLNMSQTTYLKTKDYLTKLDGMIEKTLPLYSSKGEISFAQTDTPTKLLAQNTNTPTPAPDTNTPIATNNAALQGDISQYVEGVFFRSF